MLNVAVCVSGGGTNLQALIDSVSDGRITDARIVLVLSNNPGAYALERAKNAGIPTAVVSRGTYPDPEEFDRALLDTLQASGAELVVLAGFLVNIPPVVVRAFPERIINVHPSLIPSFCGQGFYGLRVHEAALKRGVKVTGATVHFVDEGTDTGPVILQQAVPVMENDTPETLQRRVMEQAEWVLLPRAVQLIAHGMVRVRDGLVYTENNG